MNPDDQLSPTIRKWLRLDRGARLERARQRVYILAVIADSQRICRETVRLVAAGRRMREKWRWRRNLQAPDE